MEQKLLQFLGGQKKRKIRHGEIWILPAIELLQAQKEAAGLAAEDLPEAGLCLNACVLARAVRKNGRRVFSDGRDVLSRVSAERIEQWMQTYLKLCAEENPSCCDEDQEQMKKMLAEAPYERLKWKVLKSFGVLPSEQRAKALTDGDYLYCAVQLTLDEEEYLQSLCPQCRAEALKEKCPVCGAESFEENAGFDEDRFEELKHADVH